MKTLAVLFVTLASFLAGLAWSEGSLIAARAPVAIPA